MDGNPDNRAEERMLDADFASDDLDLFGYRRSDSTVTLPLGHDQDDQVGLEKNQDLDDLADLAAQEALVVRRVSRAEPHNHPVELLHDLAPVPQRPTQMEAEGERPALNQTTNFNLKLSIDSGGTRVRRRPRRSVGHDEEAVDKRRLGGGEEGRRVEPHTHPSRGHTCNPCTILILLLVVLAATALLLADGVDKHIVFEPTSPRKPTPPSAIADSLTKLEYDAIYLERRHERATAHLPAGAGLRDVLAWSTQPRLLRREDLRARLLGEEYESNIVYHLRTSEARLRSVLGQVGGPDSMGRRLRAAAPRWMSPSLDPQVYEVVRAERARAAAMVEEARRIVAALSESRDSALRACQSRPRQDAEGAWVLDDNSVCRSDEEGAGSLGAEGVGSAEGESDAKTALGFINWICQDLDTMTMVVDDRGADADADDAQVQSLAAEAARVLERWEGLAGQWEMLAEL
ncbi:hypothetical protein KVR01_002711 [Diaporthe batatas]|uniref:uncharacterized protein n=1 Tax=Diaporthe batatas TaxID=748121 RepID=UPI001D03E6FE|nr:uncharacterized protein KVR01_002711 [Diaporthe batatas]KAG8167022.1 hypothetical protein KVR01_002711 [Diaporthe batatas]